MTLVHFDEAMQFYVVISRCNKPITFLGVLISQGSIATLIRRSG